MIINTDTLFTKMNVIRKLRTVFSFSQHSPGAYYYVRKENYQTKPNDSVKSGGRADAVVMVVISYAILVGYSRPCNADFFLLLSHLNNK